MEFGLYQKENGFAGNVKRLKKNLLKWFVKKLDTFFKLSF